MLSYLYDIGRGRIYSLNKEDKTSTFATCSGTADVVSSQTGVTGASNATGATDGSYAQLYESGNVLVLDLTDELLTGATYTIRWRRGTSTSNNPSITIEESNDNSTWSAAVNSPYSFSTQTFLTRIS